MSSYSQELSPPQHLELVAIEVANLAADLVRASIGSAATARTKSSPTDVVTHTDFASEQLIRSELLARCPGSSLIGEEYDDHTGGNGIGWIIDPIDGTVNFLYDLPVVSVSIAATLDEVVVAGAVVDLLRRETFSAAKSEGARCNQHPINSARTTSLSQALIGTGFSYDEEVRASEASIVSRVLPECRDIRCMGSAALNLCWVGCGRLDGFYERDIKVYDYAAGALIASEAGAQVELPAANNTDLTISATDSVFAPLRALVSL